MPSQQLATTTSRLLQPTRNLAAAVWKPVAVRAMSAGSVPSVPPDADIKAAREGEPQYHGSGAALNPDDTGAGRASESTAAEDKDATQPTAADEEFAMNEPKDTAEAGGSSDSGSVNPPGFDTTAATDLEGGSFSGGGATAPSPGLPSTGSPTRGFSQD